MSLLRKIRRIFKNSDANVKLLAETGEGIANHADVKKRKINEGIQFCNNMLNKSEIIDCSNQSQENEINKVKKACETIKDAYGCSSYFWGDRMLILDKTAGFLKDERFNSIFSSINTENDLSIAWRLHVLLWATKNSLGLEGDFVECGTFLGDMAWMIVNYLKFDQIDKKFYLYDSFEGLHPVDASKQDYPEHMGTFDFLKSYYKEKSNYNFVVKRFSAYKNITITKGFLPESLEKSIPEKICFLHIDLNSPISEYKTIERLYDLLVPGAIVIYDDYGWCAFEKSKQAADDFAKDRGYCIVELPTGQGLFIKR